jgi:chromosome partitioning protein
VTLASPKGGVGKTTTALLLATMFIDRAARVAVLDCDPNQPLTRWAAEGRTAPTVIGGIKTDSLLTIVDEEAARQDLVIVDLEGAASRLAGYAIARSDLVLVPMGASTLDAAEAARAVGLVKREEQLLRRPIACRVLFTRTGHIPTKAEKAIKRDLAAAGVAMLGTHVAARVAFEVMFAERATLRELDPAKVNGLAAAIANAEALIDEVSMVLSDLSNLTKGRAAA